MLAVAVRTSASGSRELIVDTSFPRPRPGSGEVLLNITLAGICGTDLEIVSGYKEIPDAQILGHEFLAEVVSYAPDVPMQNRVDIGTRVVAEINCVSQCSPSQTAAERAQDPARTAVGIFGRPGAFAELLTVPVENVHVVPSSVPDEAAVFTEPIAAACEILEQVNLRPSDRVAVLGAGRLGWLVTAVLAGFKHNVTVLTRGRYQERDIKLAEQYRVKVGEIGKGVWVDAFTVVVDCTGSPAGLALAISFVCPRGTIVLKSTTAPGKGEAVDLTPVVVKEITIVGSRCGPFPTALRLLEKGLVDPRPLVDSIFEPKDAGSAFERAKQSGVLKVLLK